MVPGHYNYRKVVLLGNTPGVTQTPTDFDIEMVSHAAVCTAALEWQCWLALSSSDLLGGCTAVLLNFGRILLRREMARV